MCRIKLVALCSIIYFCLGKTILESTDEKNESHNKSDHSRKSSHPDQKIPEWKQTLFERKQRHLLKKTASE